ncbi:MAG TPA: YdeI/OmpD-associated family protein [Pseudomonadales bacterium]|nr:YdeI/OmpD-associated family protein [Pseudomonadales bacterium]
MGKKDPRVDTYIAGAGDFAKPILNRIRKLVHAACPQVEEAIKWNSPFFVHKGILVAMPAFKKHCALIFWKGKLILGKERAKLRRLTSAADLPSDKILLGYIRKAVELNESGVKAPMRRAKRKEIAVPDYFLAALKKNSKARAAFENFSPSHRREYVEWITSAKLEETRVRRVEKALKTLAQGKSHNAQYR